MRLLDRLRVRRQNRKSPQAAHVESNREKLDRYEAQSSFDIQHWQDITTLLVEAGEFASEIMRAELRGLLPNYLLPTQSWTPEQRFYLAAAYVFSYATAEAVHAFMRGEKVILGLRVETSTKAHMGLGRYDDRFVIVQRQDQTFSGTAVEFPGNTEPAYKYDAKNPKKSAAFGKDVDGDGVVDLGRIPAGTHQFMKGHSAKRGNILRPYKTIRLERDSNHDGLYGNDKVKIGLQNGLDAIDTLFHKGGRGGFTGSAGCQTLEAPVFERFWAATGSQKHFYYVIIKVR